MEYYLAHHGIKGQKWGIRRFQNEDGSYTDEGERHRGKKTLRQIRKDYKTANRREDIKLGRKFDELDKSKASQDEFGKASSNYYKQRSLNKAQYHKDRAEVFQNRSKKIGTAGNFLLGGAGDEYAAKARKERIKSNIETAKAFGDSEAVSRGKAELRNFNMKAIALGGGGNTERYIQHRDAGESVIKSILKTSVRM